MRSNRRDFLRFFAAGATIIPVVDGLPSPANQAKIIDPPKVEPITQMPSIEQLHALARQNCKYGVVMFFTAPSGQVVGMQAEAFIPEYRWDSITVNHVNGVSTIETIGIRQSLTVQLMNIRAI